MKFISTSVSLAALFASGLADVEIDFGTTTSFSLVAVGGINNVGTSGPITGDVATTGHTVNGFPAGALEGTVNTRNAVADQVRADALAVYNQLHPLQGTLVTATPDGTITVEKGPGDLDGHGTTNFSGAVFTPGIYNVLSILEVVTNITLSGAGQFIFTTGSHTRLSPGAQIILADGADVSNVFFASGDSANFSSGSLFQGRFFGDSAVFMQDGATAIGGLYSGGLMNFTNAGGVTLVS